MCTARGLCGRAIKEYTHKEASLRPKSDARPSRIPASRPSLDRVNFLTLISIAMASKARGTWCSAPNCQNSRKKGFRLFSFPKDEGRCKKWIQNCRREDLIGKTASYLHANCCLCSEHFEASQFTNPSSKTCRLIRLSVPTLFDVPNPPPTMTSKRPLPKRQTLPEKRSRKNMCAKPPETVEESRRNQDDTCLPSTVPQTADSSNSLEPSPIVIPPPGPSALKELSPKKRALKEKIRHLQQQLRRLKTTELKKANRTRNCKESLSKKKSRLLDELKDFLPPSTMRFVATQIRVAGQNGNAFRWSPSEKALALSLIHTSPKAYRMLQKMLNLPSVSTLRRVMQKIKIFPGFNNNILQALKRKVSALPAGGDVCAIVFDEMTIKEGLSYNIEEDNIEGLEDFGNQRTSYAANHATVFMVRGLLQPWKQAVGYFLSSGTINSSLLKSLLSQCVTVLTEIGLNVKAVICDQGSNNRKAITDLGVTQDRTSFFSNDKAVYVFYDPPHLLKNTRNNLKKTGFVQNNKDVDWTYIEEFFKLDSQNAVKMAPKLTQKHIRLPGFSALRVKFAAQVLSHSVAAGISTMVTLKALPEHAMETALFVERIDQLFNTFNSNSKCSNQKMRHAMSETSGHKAFLEETLTWLSTLETKSSRPLPCIMGWKLSIKSLLLLWEDLHAEYKARFLYTSKLNQDCLENLFSVIRGKGGHGDNPSAKQFRLFLRQVMVDSILLQSKASNCIEDGDHFLLTLNNMTRQREYSTAVDNMPDPPEEHRIPDAGLVALAFNIPTEELSLQEENTLTYIAGYVARKVRGKVCGECREVLVGRLEGLPKETLLTKKQLPDLQGEGLIVPSAELVSVVEQLETVFKKSEQLLHMDRVRTRYLERMDKEGDVLVCPSGICKLSSYVVNLYLNIRLHFAVKENNRSFAASSGRKNRKMLKLQHL